MKYVKLFAVMLVAALMVVMGCEKTKKMSSEGGPDSMDTEGQIDPGMMDGMGDDPGEEGEEGGDEGDESPGTTPNTVTAAWGCSPPTPSTMA